MVDANGGLVLLLTEVLTGLVVLLVLATTVARAWRRRRERAVARAEAQARPIVLAALDGEAEAGGPSSRLQARVERQLEFLAAGLAGKLRGADRAALVELLRRRGIVDRARERTRSLLARRRLRAVEQLGALGVAEAVPELVARLEDSDAEVRRAAVRALGRTTSPAAVPALLALLDAPRRTESAHYITLALLRIGPGAAEKLIRALDTHGPRGRAAAAKVLGWLGETSAVVALTRALDDDEDDVRAAAVDALGRIGLPTAAPRMRELLAPGGSASVRLAATVALGRLGDPASTEVLSALLDEEPSEHRHRLARAAATSLAHLGGRGHQALRDAAYVPEAGEVLAGLDLPAPEPAPAATRATSTSTGGRR